MRIRSPHESSEVSDGSSSTLRTLLCPRGPTISSETKKMFGGANDAPRNSTIFGWRSVARMSASFFKLSSEAGSWSWSSP